MRRSVALKRRGQILQKKSSSPQERAIAVRCGVQVLHGEHHAWPRKSIYRSRNRDELSVRRMPFCSEHDVGQCHEDACTSKAPPARGRPANDWQVRVPAGVMSRSVARLLHASPSLDAWRSIQSRREPLLAEPSSRRVATGDLGAAFTCRLPIPLRSVRARDRRGTPG